METPISLKESFKKHLGLDLNDKEVEEIVFDDNFVSSLPFEKVIQIWDNVYNYDLQYLNLSVFLNALNTRPIELAKSSFLDRVCERFEILGNIGVDRIRHALNNGKQEVILDYFYNDLPKKTIKKHCELYEENENVKDFFQRVYPSFAIPTSRNLKNFSHALNVCDDLFVMSKNLEKNTDREYRKEETIKDILITGLDYNYYYKFDLLPQTEEGFKYKAKMAKIIFEEGLFSFWQNYFKFEGTEIVPIHDDERFNQSLAEVFDLKNLTPDDKISFYIKMINDCENTETTNIYYDSSKEILEIIKNCNEETNKLISYQIVSGQINYFFNEGKTEEAFYLINNQTYQSLAEKYSPDIDIQQLFNSNNMEAIHLFFDDKKLEDCCLMEFKNDHIKDKINILLEKQRLSIQLSNF